VPRLRRGTPSVSGSTGAPRLCRGAPSVGGVWGRGAARVSRGAPSVGGVWGRGAARVSGALRALGVWGAISGPPISLGAKLAEAWTLRTSTTIPGSSRAYSTLERFGAGWKRAMEHADLLALLPDVNVGGPGSRLRRRAARAPSGDERRRRGQSASTCRSGCWPWRERSSPIRVSRTLGPGSRTSRSRGRFDLVASVLVFHYVDDYAGWLDASPDGWRPAVSSCIRLSIRSTRRAPRARAGTR